MANKKIIIPPSAYKIHHGLAVIPMTLLHQNPPHFQCPYVDQKATYMFNIDSKRPVSELTFASQFFITQFPIPITIRFIPTSKIKAMHIVQKESSVAYLGIASAFATKGYPKLEDTLNFRNIEFDGFNTNLKLEFLIPIKQTSLILQAKSIDLTITRNTTVEKIWLNSKNIKLDFSDCYNLKEIKFDYVEHLNSELIKFKNLGSDCVFSFPKNIKINTNLIWLLNQIDLFNSLDLDNYLKTINGFLPTWIDLEQDVKAMFPNAIKGARIILTYKQYKKIIKAFAFNWLQKLIDNKTINDSLK